MHVEFAEPWFLLRFPVPLFLWLWRRRGRRAASVIRRLASSTAFRGGRLPRWFGEVSRLLAVTAAVLALSGPRTPDLKTRMPAEGIAIVFALERLGSMQETTFVWDSLSAPISRAEAARDLFACSSPAGTGRTGRTSTAARPNAGRTLSASSPSRTGRTRSARRRSITPFFLEILDHVPPPTARDTGTNVGDAIAEGVLRLDRTNAKRPKCWFS